MINNTTELPRYLVPKLATVKIDSLAKLRKVGYLKAFAWLKQLYPQLSYKALYDLYSVYHAQPLNTLHKTQQVELVKNFKNMLPSYIMLDDIQLNHYLSQAHQLAKQAYIEAEVPIGAVVVQNEQVIGYGYNQTITHGDIMAHAEIMAIRMAQDKLGNHRLTNCDLYVTIEPCLMCAGAIMHARIRRVVFGAVEPLTGACVSQYQVFNNVTCNHFAEIIGPLNNKLYGKLIKEFFHKQRI